MGRKAKYDLPDGFYDTVIELMKEGASIKEVIAELELTPSAHARLRKDEPAYAEALEIGEVLSEGWWMKQGRLSLNDKTLNVANYCFQMKNRFKWRDTPLVVQGTERKLSEKYQEKEVLEKYKVKEEKEDEKVIN